MRRLSSVALLFLFVALSSTEAGELREGRISKIINEVSVIDPANGTRRAELQQVIKEDLALKDRAEVAFTGQVATTQLLSADIGD